jgi:hypothetical protein
MRHRSRSRANASIYMCRASLSSAVLATCRAKSASCASSCIVLLWYLEAPSLALCDARCAKNSPLGPSAVMLRRTTVSCRRAAVPRFGISGVRAEGSLSGVCAASARRRSGRPFELDLRYVRPAVSLRPVRRATLQSWLVILCLALRLLGGGSAHASSLEVVDAAAPLVAAHCEGHDAAAADPAAATEGVPGDDERAPHGCCDDGACSCPSAHAAALAQPAPGIVTLWTGPCAGVDSYLPPAAHPTAAQFRPPA